jgi:thioredoxin 1
MREITDATFEGEVLGAGRPVVLEFWAPWCQPCRAVTQVMEQLASDFEGRIDFAKLNIDENHAVPSRYGVLTIPTAILFAGGEEREKLIGARPRGHYERALTAFLEGSAG